MSVIVRARFVSPESAPQEIAIDLAEGYPGNAIFIEGLGDCTSQPGYGAPMVIEMDGEQMRLIVWADINQEDPTHIISLEGAKESNRIPEAVAHSAKPES